MRAAEVTETNSQAKPERNLTDCHVHLAALPHEGNGCYISPRMLKSPLFRFLLWKFKLDVNDPAGTNAKYVADLLAELRSSRYVGRAILLGMDGVYDERGKLDEQATEFLISNDYVLKVVKTYPEDFWAGVSTNPQRGDALEELARCAAAGAKLVKVLPNAQQFDPAQRRYIPFYRALAKHRLPLLSHVGYEFSLAGKDQSAGDPSKLRVPLEEGVAVIAAHGCSYGLVFHEKFYKTFVELCRSYANFFSDISALTLVNRFGMLLKLRRHPELHSRLLFGTDYPLPVLHAACWGRIGLGSMRGILRAKSRFDRQYLVCRELKVGFSSFEQVFAAGS